MSTFELIAPICKQAWVYHDRTVRRRIDEPSKKPRTGCCHRKPVNLAGASDCGLFDSNADSNAGELWRTPANNGELSTPAVDFKTNAGEPARMLADDAPANFKTSGRVLGDVDGRIVPVAPPPTMDDWRQPTLKTALGKVCLHFRWLGLS